MSLKPLCFVIMGFGRKTDLGTGKTIDLDKTYQNVIKPAAVKAGFECVRADEIDDSGLIDKSMYALLLRAELVVADISTYNPNAIYELGVRHAARPYSTIIIKERSGKIPFDLDHTRIFMYDHLGEDIGVDESERCVTELSLKMSEIKARGQADSPLYELLPGVRPPEMNDADYERIIGDLAKRESSIFALSEAALTDKANERWVEAAHKWKKAAELSDNDPYFIQQRALAVYKSQQPAKLTALTDALGIIGRLDPENSNDPETLGITGAIYKNLYLETRDLSYLSRAIDHYKRGFAVAGSYYTGENYANCLDLKYEVETDSDEQVYLRLESRNTRQAIIAKLLELDETEIVIRSDALWIFATLSNCNRALGNDTEADSYEEKFRASSPQTWEVRTFETTKISMTKRRER
jgi:tetratricopeptide (TPR) repeat protein